MEALAVDAGAIFPYAAEPKVAVPVCPVCGTANAAVATHDRYGYEVPMVARCTGCTLGYLGEQMTRAGY